MKRPRLRFALAAVAGLVICYAGERERGRERKGALHFRAALAAPQAAEAWQKTRSADDCHNSGGRGRDERRVDSPPSKLIITPLMIILLPRRPSSGSETKRARAKRLGRKGIFPHPHINLRTALHFPTHPKSPQLAVHFASLSLIKSSPSPSAASGTCRPPIAGAIARLLAPPGPRGIALPRRVVPRTKRNISSVYS